MSNSMFGPKKRENMLTSYSDVGAYVFKKIKISCVIFIIFLFKQNGSFRTILLIIISSCKIVCQKSVKFQHFIQGLNE